MRNHFPFWGYGEALVPKLLKVGIDPWTLTPPTFKWPPADINAWRIANAYVVYLEQFCREVTYARRWDGSCASFERHLWYLRSGIRTARKNRARCIGTHTKEEWNEYMEACDFRCQKCGAEGVHKDHIVPLCFPYISDGMENLQPLCPECNRSKGASETIDYRTVSVLVAERSLCSAKQTTA